MKKLLVTLFAALACATAVVPAALGAGVANTGTPGPLDNCTAISQGHGQQLSGGQSWHACDVE